MDISDRLNDAAYNQKQGKLIILMQVPWKFQESNDKQMLLELKAKMERLNKSDQVERVILFGIDQTSPQLLSSSFSIFNTPGKKRIFDSSIDIAQIDNWLQAIRRDNLGLECPSRQPQ